jgi:EmrB/QacA subfamily drug resistance transporter
VVVVERAPLPAPPLTAGYSPVHDEPRARAVTAVRLGEASGRWVIFAAVLGSGMAMLDATVVNVALPALGDDLGAGLDGLQWTLNGYTLTLASFILLGGSLGDRFGRRRVFVIGTIWFAVASLLCGAAPTVELLVAARALQGVGGALLTPGSLAMIAALFQGEERGRAIGLWSGLGGIAGAIGPFVGGWLIASVGWRWIFFVNLPLAAAVVYVAVRHVPETSDAGASKSIDAGGAALGAIGLAGLTYALVQAGEGGATRAVLLAGAAGVAALVGFVLFERRSRHPMLPLELFASRQFSAANAVTFLVYAALGGVFFLLVMHLQIVGGFSPLVAGTTLLPITALMLLLSGPAGALAERIGPRLPMAAGPMVSAAGVALMLRIGADASYLTDVLPAVVVFGLGLSLTVAPLTATVLGAAAARFAGIASGVNNAVARAAGLLAVAVLPLAAGLAGDDYMRPEVFAGGFRVAALLASGVLATGGLLAALAIRGRVADGEPTVAPARVHCAVAGPALHPHAPLHARR